MTRISLNRRATLTGLTFFCAAHSAAGSSLPRANRIHYRERACENVPVWLPQFWLKVENAPSLTSDSHCNPHMVDISVTRFLDSVRYAVTNGFAYPNDKALPDPPGCPPLYIVSLYQDTTPAGTYTLPRLKVSGFLDIVLPPPPVA